MPRFEGAFDVAERVACPYCNSLLDCSEGKLQYLETLKQSGVKPLIPLGTVGTLEGKPYTVIGFLLRHVVIEGTKYQWQEFLLYSIGIGFRWLVESDGHWSFVKSVPPGEVQVSGQAATYHGRAFRLFQSAPAFVDQVAGEFYWKVHIGEEVLSSDYVEPPRMLSREISLADGAPGPLAAHGEINWSLGTYLTRQEVAKAFKVDGLPWPKGVGPNQPFGSKAVYPVWAVLIILAFVILADSMLAAARAFADGKGLCARSARGAGNDANAVRAGAGIGCASDDPYPRRCAGEQFLALRRW